MSKFSSQWRHATVDCEIIRNGIKIATYKGLINDSKDNNFISFDVDVNIQVNDDIYCPLKNKHYHITNTDIALFGGKAHRLDAYFENNFIKPTTNTVFNTYNPTNSVIGNQQNVVLNFDNCFNNLQSQIEQFGNEDKDRLYELLETLKTETSNNQINKSVFSKFNDLLIKHGPWVVPSIAQIIAVWLQRG